MRIHVPDSSLRRSGRVKEVKLDAAVSSLTPILVCSRVAHSLRLWGAQSNLRDGFEAASSEGEKSRVGAPCEWRICGTQGKTGETHCSQLIRLREKSFLKSRGGSPLRVICFQPRVSWVRSC